MDGQELELRAVAPDAVVLNYLRPGNEGLVHRLVDAGVSVFVLDTEGGVFTNIDRYGQILSRDDALRGRIAGWLSWGPRLAEHALASRWFRAEQIVVTGSPRFDFYVTPWRDAALARVTDIADGRRMVLVNGNFPIANPRFQTPAEEARMLVRRFGFDPDDVARWSSTQQQTMSGVVAVANRAARDHPEAFVVYRPHPFERLDTYDRLLDPRPNLVARKDGGVDAWILRAAAVVQRSCTTAIEAGLAGVPALSPRWVPIHEEMPAAEAVSIPAASQDELDEQLTAALAGDLAVPDAQRAALDGIVADWFLTIDGDAHRRVADAILDRTTEGDRGPRAARLGVDGPRARARSWVKATVPPSLWRLRPGRREPAWRRSEKQFSADDVVRIVQGLAAGGVDDVEAAPAEQVWRYRFGRSVTLTRRGSRRSASAPRPD